MNRSALIFVFLLAFFQPLGGQTARQENTVILDDSGIANLGLETIEVAEQSFEKTVFALGRLDILPGNRAIVSSRIPGRATSVLVKPDMAIEEGEELMSVESRQPGDPPPVIKLVAPISGVVTRVETAVGQPVSPEDSLIEIVDLSNVHARASVPEHFAGRLELGQVSHITVPAYPDKSFDAPLAHLGALADGETGTVEAIFHLDNPEGLLRPGMRAEFSIVVDARNDVMAIPLEALQGDLIERFVYIKDYELKNAFMKVPVVTGEENERYIEIISGLLPGDEVVTQGAYSLAFAGKGSVSLKEALDAAHGHPHNEDGSEIGEGNAPDAEQADEEHSHAHHGGSRLTLFLAGTSLLFLALLILSLFTRKPAAC